MRVKWNIILTAPVCALLLAAGLTGCGESVLEEGRGSVTQSEGRSYVMFNVTSVNNARRTRADDDPTAGEWGDGRERGQTYENEVNTVAVFLYQDADGVNGNASTPVTMLYFGESEVSGRQNTNNNIDYIATTAAKEVELEAGQYNVLAVVNPAGVEWAGDGLTLGTLRDHIETDAWAETDGSYSSFLMTSENEGKGVNLDYNPEQDPAVATVDVERMAARIDYRAEGTYTIEAEDDATYAGASVVITGAALVNNLNAGSYEMKRVNSGLGQGVTYLGEETVDAEGIATNYVIDPWTEEKDGTNDLSSLYGVYYPGYATDEEEQNPSYWAGLVKEGTQVRDEDNTAWNIVGYTMENTTYADYTSKQYSTGLVFGARFTPAEGTVVDGFYADYDFVYGESTFFKWNSVLYATAEDMMAAAYPNVFTTENMFGETTFAGISDLDGLATFIATLRDDDPTGYKAYLQGIEEFPTDKSALYWENYMVNSCHYYFDTDVPALLIGEDCRALLNEATGGAVSTYEESRCYYTWWVRHSNDGSNETNGVMEYSIVRNNIYKVRVNSVYSIGGDIPQEGVRAFVYVRNWTLLPSETIDL